MLYFILKKILQKSTTGYFLMVEAGRIDSAHHQNWATRALNETVAFDKAISLALSMVDVKDTLVIVTADHTHGFSITGHAYRGSKITGKKGNENPTNTIFNPK